jgi:hypothetical protein
MFLLHRPILKLSRPRIATTSMAVVTSSTMNMIRIGVITNAFTSRAVVDKGTMSPCPVVLSVTAE